MVDVGQRLTPPQAYEQYFAPAIFQPLASALLDLAAPRTGEQVLDVACGTGVVARRVAPMIGASGRVVGVDINPAMIEVARAQSRPEGAPIEWRQGDAAALDIPTGTFGLALCQQGLQFLPDRAAGMREMRRVLADGGRVALAVWHGIGRHPLYEALAKAELQHLRELGATVTRADLEAPFSLGDVDELRDLLTEAGFRDLDLTSRSIEARFATPDRFVERMEYAYSAVVPELAENPTAFATFVEKVSRDTEAIVQQFRHGEWVVVPMHAHIAVAGT